MSKVKKILEDILDSIQSPSPAVKIQIMARKVDLKCEGKKLLGLGGFQLLDLIIMELKSHMTW